MQHCIKIGVLLMLLSNVAVAQSNDPVDFEALFKGKKVETIKKATSSDQEIEDTAIKDEILLSAADSYNAESDYARALKFLHKMKLQNTARWCDVAASAYLGDRQFAKAKEVFICAKEEYEKEGNTKKAHDMQAHINFLTPKK